MSDIWQAWGAILAGTAGLIWGADRFVAGAAAVARNLGISQLIIGLTIVSFGTSAPEIIVAVNAALRDAGDLAIGNALGSNLANIGLVLAVTALVAPLPIQRHVLVQEIPLLLLVTTTAGALLYDAALGFWEGLLLLLALGPLLYYMTRMKKGHLSAAEMTEETADIPQFGNLVAAFWFALGLGLMVGCSDMLVWGAKTVALAFGVSPLLIGLTVIAVGTSLPELAASVMSALKGHTDIALGNIIGSNIFNIMAVMTVPGIIAPLTMEAEVFGRDYAAMACLTLLLAGAVALDYKLRNRAGHSGGQARLGRRIAVILLLSYIGYYAILFK